MKWEYFENQTDGHNKWWAIASHETTMVTLWGPIGSRGQISTTKYHRNDQTCQTAIGRAMGAKLNGGYKVRTSRGGRSEKLAYIRAAHRLDADTEPRVGEAPTPPPKPGKLVLVALKRGPNVA